MSVVEPTFQPSSQDPSIVLQSENTISEGPGSLVVQENHSIDEYIFDGDLLDERVTSSNILAVSEAMVIQGLTILSEELPRSTGTSYLPKWDNTLRSLATRHQNNGILDVDKEDIMEQIGFG